MAKSAGNKKSASENLKKLWASHLKWASLIVLFAAAATYVVVTSHAATPVNNGFEPEDGALTGTATKITDATASGGFGVRFDAPVSTGTFGISVAGKNFLDGSGTIVRLHGVNRSGTEYMCPSGNVFDGPSDAASIDVMLTWHVNAVRVPINEQCWLGINGLPGGITATQYQQAITTYVNILVSKKIYPIIELHWAAPGTTQSVSSTQQVPMADRDHAPAMWTSIANTYKNNPAVIFDLFNEPFPDNNSNTTAAWTCWKNGGTCSGVNYVAAGMQELTTTVRNTGATNVILLGGVGYSGYVNQWNTYKPTDPLNQLAASQHNYNFGSCLDVACWDASYAGIGNAPMVEGEIGSNDCSPAYSTSFLNWADTKGVSYLGWAWNPYGCGFPSLIENYDGTPSAMGQAFKTHYLQVFP